MLHKPSRKALSAIVTLVVAALFVFSVPVQAFTMDVTAPETAESGSIVNLQLTADIETGENIPAQEVALWIYGPESTQMCTFAIDGTPLDGCDGLTITATDDSLNSESERVVTGFDGTANTTTNFGFGAGHAENSVDNEFTWSVDWDTTGLVDGAYIFDYALYAADGAIESFYTTEYIVGTAIGTSAYLSVDPEYPQANHYVLYCDAFGFNATAYEWDFGDGNTQTTTTTDVYHIFADNGNYTVTCTASDDTQFETATLDLEVTQAPAPVENTATSAILTVADSFPQDNNYVFNCNAEGFTATSYSWDFGDGNTQETTTSDVYHTFTYNGDYSIACSATDGTVTESATLDISVSGGAQTPEEPPVVVEPASCSVFTQDVTCASGVVLSDSDVDSCRQIICDNGVDSTTVLACGKENDTFEMYVTANAGNQIDVCISGTCLSGSGYASGALACGNDEEQPPAEEPTVSVRVAPFYPQGRDYVFVCDTGDFAAQTYDWDFGDGDIQYDSTNHDVFHTFSANGVYTVNCSATSGDTTLTGSTTVTVNALSTGGTGDTNSTNSSGSSGGGSSAASVALSIKSGFPQDTSYVLVCQASGFVATSYDWYFGDGQKLVDTQRGDVFHTYAPDAVYDASCTARSATKSATGMLSITVGTPPIAQEPGDEGLVCYDTVYDIPATCSGGSITTDALMLGCRYIVCEDGAQSAQVLACNKPGDNDAQRVELYMQSTTGGLEVCLGSACIDGNGFASADLPLCMSADEPAPTPQPSVSVDVAPWFPQGNHYVFVCDAEDFTPTSYSWVFGDGETLSGLSSNDVYHVFSVTGEHTVACTATDGTNTVSGSMDVTIA